MTRNAISTSILEAGKRLLRVALIGAPNAGKSTLLNRLILSDISCVSNKVHTTRKNILGVYTEGDTQLEFYDSPGVVTRQHVLKHHLEDSLLKNPPEAAKKCDLIAVVVDASNERERRRLNRGILAMLNEHSNKKSYLILNKVDLVKEKRLLLDIGSRLSEANHNRRYLTSDSQLGGPNADNVDDAQRFKSIYKHVIELDSNKTKQLENKEDWELSVGYRNFNQIFSISALNDDGVDELRECMIDLAAPVDTWPHGSDFLTDQKTKDIVHSIIRGKVMDYVDHAIPYVIAYKYQECRYDDLGSLHINLDLIAPKRYMIGKLLGEHGVIIFKITNESRESISKTLACDVKLNITVKSNGNKK